MDPVPSATSAFDGNIRFRDLETGETLTTQAEGVRRGVPARPSNDWRESIEVECRKRSIDRVELVTTDPLDRAVLDYLVKRARTF